MEKVIEIKPFSGVEFDKILSDKEATLISSVKMLFDKFFSTQLPAAVAMMIAEVNKIIKQNHSRIPMLENHMREAANYKEADGQEKIISEVMQYLYMLPSDNIVTLINLLKHEGSPLSKLRVLVLRGCDMLESIDHVKKMESLEMLEISGARSLKEIPDEVFGKMPKLRSLHLSALPVKYLPSSFSELTELRWLILRDWSCLEEVPSLKAFKSLQLVDISGACSLAKFEDKKVDSPVEINPEALTYFSLGGCDQLNELFTLKTCSGLQILDLSDNNSLRETSIDFLATQGLRILDMSKTKIGRLPSNLSNLTRLEWLDLSDILF
ncbi:probable disease resistance protein At5g45510 [Ziziphus jujuba]|uniref:Probable disease resistance protein At5g45510 n=1 Tax=Ziziphus jujuba TaxID=326968 RepID=A0ABM3IMI9_ZIZJJ|nr:probable disease resistance protein At5g45510 [Ziziphus jujuba]